MSDTFKDFINFFHERRADGEFAIRTGQDKNVIYQSYGSWSSIFLLILTRINSGIAESDKSSFNNNLLYELQTGVNSSSLTEGEKKGLPYINYMTEESKEVIYKWIEPIIDKKFDYLNCKNSELLRIYLDRFLIPKFYTWKLNGSKFGDVISDINQILGKTMVYEGSYYSSIQLESDDTVMKLIRFLLTEKKIIEKKTIEKKEEVLKKDVSLDKIKILKEINGLKVQGLKDKCGELKIDISKCKLKKDYVDSLYKHFGLE